MMLPRREPLAKVVVCEDDPATRELLCENLRADRFEALPAECAADALRHCHYHAPDLLLLDLMLPDAPGLDVLREIRDSHGTTGRYDPGLPVIVLSGRGDEVDRVRGLKEGADDYVVKPFSYSELSGLSPTAASFLRCPPPGLGPLGDLRHLARLADLLGRAVPARLALQERLPEIIGLQRAQHLPDLGHPDPAGELDEPGVGLGSALGPLVDGHVA